MAVEYIWQRMQETYFSADTMSFLREWQPIKKGLAHRPSDPQSAEYLEFRERLRVMTEQLASRYPGFSAD